MPAPNDASGSDSQSTAPKAIANLAKKPADTTRLGTQKMKFTPTLPVRRKKEDASQESTSTAAPVVNAARGRGRGRGGGRGGPPPRPPPVEMTASGPFAMGPALAGGSGSRRVPRSNFAPIGLGGPGGASLGQGLDGGATHSMNKDKGKGRTADMQIKVKEENEEDAEVYSDPDEGVEIVDMDEVKTMDWMAPDSLRRDRQNAKKKKKKEVVTVKKEEGEEKVIAMDVDTAAAAGEVDLANAVDLSDNEDEEELEDLIDDFAQGASIHDDPDMPQDRLYFFQFPEPFPTFVPLGTAPTIPQTTGDKNAAETGDSTDSGEKKVSFAEDTKLPAAAASIEPGTGNPTSSKIDGIIGHLEVYESGAVKMRLSNGILLDVTSATQPSFLQQAVYLDTEHKRLAVLGEVNKRFVVAPDIDSLLADMERADAEATHEANKVGDDLIRMEE